MLRYSTVQRARHVGLAAFVILVCVPAALRAQTGTAKKDTTKTKTAPTTTKAPAKPTTTTAKPTTTTKPAPTTAPTTAKPTTSTTKAAAPSGDKKTTSPSPTPTSGPAPKPVRVGASSTGGSTRAPVEAYSKVGVYAGGASAGLGFGTGPSGGIVWRKKAASFPLVLRADVSASRFSQQPSTSSGLIAGDASLLHMGAAVGLEWVLTSSGALRPYLAVSGGVYRFQGSGPAGTNGTIPGGVFTSTTDGALLGGLGLRLGQRMFVEARVVHVGDFRSIPFVVGVQF